MTPLDRVKSFLFSFSKDIRIVEFSTSTHTSELAASALGIEVGQIAKSMLLMGRSGPFMVVTCGDRKVSQKKIKEFLGLKSRFANADEVYEITGFNPGGVCPFALRTSIPIYLDISMKNYPVVYAAAGTSNTAVPVSYNQLMYITKGLECDLCI